MLNINNIIEGANSFYDPRFEFSIKKSNNYLQYQLKLAKSHALAICCFFFFFRHDVTAAVVAEQQGYSNFRNFI